MARSDNEVRTTPSVFDRLLDDAPGDSRDAPVDWYNQIRQLKRSVGRDLEALLNTRRQLDVDTLPEGLEELERSVLRYGLPDFSSVDLSSQGDRGRVCRALEKAIKIFEPRLMRVDVQMDEPRAVDRGLRFRIAAILRLDPTPEPVTFDAVLQPATQEYQVDEQA